MNKKTYSSSIKKTPYKYKESIKIAKLILNKLDRYEVYNECFINNYIEINSKERRKEVTNVVYERLLNLDNYLLSQLYNADLITSKFILVYAIAKTDNLFLDFLHEVYREACLGEKEYISIDDFDNFFKQKKQENLVVASWGNYTIEQLATGYRNILVESGLGYRMKKNIYINNIIVSSDVIEHLKMIGDTKYLEILLGGNY